MSASNLGEKRLQLAPNWNGDSASNNETTTMNPESLKVLSEHACFGGVQGFYEHPSRECASPMRFSVYRPPQHGTRPLPVLYYLAGLTCTEETFAVKAGAQRVAAELGLVLVSPDTSPRAARLPGDDEHWDFGLGAGFYVDATQAPWSRHYRMYSYVVHELPEVVAAHFGPLSGRQGIFGHSMGGHGALVCALRSPERYASVSAFAPVCAASRCPWGEKALARYLGPERQSWLAYDAAELARAKRHGATLLVDQGRADKFLDEQLKPELLREACAASGTALELRLHDLYDHGYYFIGTFVEDHLRHHARLL
jgi:S-formylglutathione hydrolase